MLWKKIFYHLQTYIMLIPGLGQEVPLEEMAVLPAGITESSGLALLPSGELLQINDSGHPPCLFLTDTLGNLLEVDCLDFAKNIDWEELAYADSIVYVGDFGNNLNDRRDQTIYMLQLNRGLPAGNLGQIRFRYAEQANFPPVVAKMNFDLEAMFYQNDTLHLFTKNRTRPFTGYTYHYKLPATAGDYTIWRTDSIKLGHSDMHWHWVNAADISPNGKLVALLGYECLWLFYDFNPGHYLQGSIKRLPFELVSQKEAMAFINDSTLIITDEKNRWFPGQKMYRLRLDPDFYQSDSMRYQVSIVPKEVIGDSIQVAVSDSVPLPILWEMYGVKGQRLLFGKLDDPPVREGTYHFSIDTQQLPAGGYVLSIILGNRPHAFKLKKTIK